MSTRGTYMIEGKLLYNHSDNYPSGAAWHLFQVLEQHGTIDFVSMIRTNNGHRQYGPDFKPTGSIYDGPAEYHYVITKPDGKIFVEVYKIPYDSKGLQFVEKLELHEFINSNLDEEDIKEAGGKVLAIKGQFKSYTNYFPTMQAKKMLQNEINNGFWMLLSHGGIGNASGNFSEAGAIAEALDQKNLINNFNKYIAPIFKAAYNHDSESTVFDWGKKEEPATK
jgi:hypothetical protein